MRPGGTGRYQINYKIARQRFRNQILDNKRNLLPGTDMDSDNNLVLMKT